MAFLKKRRRTELNPEPGLRFFSGFAHLSGVFTQHSGLKVTRCMQGDGAQMPGPADLPQDPYTPLQPTPPNRQMLKIDSKYFRLTVKMSQKKGETKTKQRHNDSSQLPTDTALIGVGKCSHQNCKASDYLYKWSFARPIKSSQAAKGKN